MRVRNKIVGLDPIKIEKANQCKMTKLEQFKTEKGGWKRVRKQPSHRGVKVVRCNFCGFFHIVKYSRGVGTI